MAAAVPYRMDEGEVDGLIATLDTAVAASKQVKIFSGGCLPAFLMEPEISGPATIHLCRQSPKRNALVSTLQRVREKRRESFMTGCGIARASEVPLLVSLSHLVRLRSGRRPYRRIEPDFVDAFFESLKHDALDRNVRLAVLNDLVAGEARQWVWAHGRQDLIAVFDCGVLLTRNRGSLVCRLVRADRGPVGRHVFAHYQSELTRAVGLSCHGRCKGQIVQFLDEFLAAFSGGGMIAKGSLN
jgi:hypothetical protein